MFQYSHGPTSVDYDPTYSEEEIYFIIYTMDANDFIVQCYFPSYGSFPSYASLSVDEKNFERMIHDSKIERNQYIG